MAELQIIARHTVKPGKEPEVFAALRRLVAASRAEMGNIDFAAYRNIDDPSSYVLLGRYTGRDALAFHRETRHYKWIMLGQILPNLAQRTVEQFDIID